MTFLRAQQSTTDVSTPAIRVNTRMVLVDVVVTDKQGHALTGLKPDNFAIEENGKKQKISSFVTPGEAAKAAPAVPTLAPGLYTNRPDFRAASGPATVLLLDAVNTPFKDQAYARLQMLNYIREQAKPDQRMAVLALTNGIHMLQDFTTDPQALLTALRNYHPQEQILKNAAAAPTSNLDGTDSPALAKLAAAANEEIRNFQSEQVGFALDRRVEITLKAMRTLSRTLGGLPGRKEVIWLTAAFPYDLIPENRDVNDVELLASLPNVRQKGVGTYAAGSVAQRQRQAYEPEIRQVAAELSSSQVAIYPVDVRGLITGSEGSAAGQSFDPVAGMQDLAASQDTMRAIAAETGGKAYVNQNEIRAGVALAMADNSAAYTIGYYPENKKWDGKYRRIKVKVDRDSEVQYRRGYFAIDPSQAKDRRPDQEVVDVLNADMPATLVTFSARAKTNDKGKLHVDFLVDANTVSAVDASGGGKKLSITLYATLFSPQGKMVANRSLKVEQEFKADVYQQIVQHGMMVPMDMETAPIPNTQLRLAVRDERTGYIGSTAGPLATQ